MGLEPYRSHRPQLAGTVFLAAGAWVIGQVTIGEHSSVWFNCVLRGDVEALTIGHHTNLQDLSVCHADPGQPCRVGDYVTVGHRAILHGCMVEDEVLIGMGAILMNGVKVGRESIVGAGALLTEGLQVPAGSLVYGSPAKIVSQLDANERGRLRVGAEHYAAVAAAYRGAEASAATRG